MKKVAGGPRKKKASLPVFSDDPLARTSAATPTAKHKE
jgi:hypothetical protein